jgi:hypothetical protein
MADLSEQIEDAAANPQTVSGDAGSVTERSIADLIAADKYLAEKAALTGVNANGGKKSGFRTLGFARARMPGGGRS